VTSCFNSSG